MYSSAATVEVFVNGVSAGVQAMPPFGYVQYQLVYEPGNVTAVGRDAGGAVVATGLLLTTGGPAALQLNVEAGGGGIAADGADVAILSVGVFDASGLLVQGAANNVTFSVSGPGTIYGVGNGDPACHEADKGVSWRSAFNGLALVIVRSVSGAPGLVTVTASSPGLTPASASFTTS